MVWQFRPVPLTREHSGGEPVRPWCAHPRAAAAPYAGIGSFFRRLFESDAPGVEYPASPRRERWRVHKIDGDGRCMFRATVRSLARGKGRNIGRQAEEVEAEQLRQACHSALCRSEKRSKNFKDARTQVIHGYGGMRKYCQQLARPTHWGGEVEMMILSRMLRVPFYVYKPMSELKGGANAEEGECKMLVKFGSKFLHFKKTTREPVRLLYTGGNHYDLLL